MFARIGLLLALVYREIAAFGSIGILIYMLSTVNLKLTATMVVLYLSHYVANAIASNTAEKILEEKHSKIMEILNNEDIEQSRENIIGFSKGTKRNKDSEERFD